MAGPHVFDGQVQWAAVLHAPKGEQLVVGRTYAVRDQVPQAPTANPNLDFTGNGRRCAFRTDRTTFRVDALALRPDGRPSSADVTVHAECAPPLRGGVDAHLSLVNPPPQKVGARSTFSRDARGRLYARTVLSCVQPTPVSLQHVAVLGGRDIARPDVVTACAPGRFNVWQGEVTPPAALPAGPLTLRTQVMGWDQVSSERAVGATTVTVTPALRRSLALPRR